MTRSRYQPGPAQDHYHNALGPGEDVTGIPTIRYRGPIRVRHDDPDLNNPVNFGEDIFTVPAGSLFQVFAIITTTWNAAGTLTIVASEDGVSGPNILVAEYGSNGDVIISTRSTVGGIYGEKYRTNSQTPTWQRATIDAHIVVGFYPDDDEPTAGEADVYVLVAEPD